MGQSFFEFTFGLLGHGFEFRGSLQLHPLIVHLPHPFLLFLLNSCKFVHLVAPQPHLLLDEFDLLSCQFSLIYHVLVVLVAHNLTLSFPQGESQGFRLSSQLVKQVGKLVVF